MNNTFVTFSVKFFLKKMYKLNEFYCYKHYVSDIAYTRVSIELHDYSCDSRKSFFFFTREKLTTRVLIFHPIFRII